MLGSDKGRGYCLEMICADFLAGANLDNSEPDLLLKTLSRYFEFLPSKAKRHSSIRSVNISDDQQANVDSCRRKALC